MSIKLEFLQSTPNAEKKKLADRIQSLSEAQQWKNKASVVDHNHLAGNYAFLFIFR